MEIREDDLSHPQTIELLRLHLAGIFENSPPGGVFALDLSGLKARDVTVWSLWREGKPIGIGALKQHDAMLGEIKSMRTHPNALRKGVGTKLLDHIIAVARERGLQQLSLETGSGDAFEPALALYRRYGFENGPAFANYEASDFNQFLHRHLAH